MSFDPDKLSAVFFDLDDTLIDTAGLLVGPALAAAANRMVEAGLRAPVDELERFLKAQVAGARGGNYFEAAVDEFGTLGATRSEIVYAGRRAYLGRDVPQIAPLPGCRRLLRGLGQRCQIFLITAGDPRTQRAKVERLALADAFDAIRWVDSVHGQTKLPAFREIIELFGLDTSRCACVGDRVVGEIADGNRLGMWTIRVRRGEFAAVDPANQEEAPDFTAADLFEVAELLGQRWVDGGNDR